MEHYDRENYYGTSHKSQKKKRKEKQVESLQLLKYSCNNIRNPHKTIVEKLAKVLSKF